MKTNKTLLSFLILSIMTMDGMTVYAETDTNQNTPKTDPQPSNIHSPSENSETSQPETSQPNNMDQEEQEDAIDDETIRALIKQREKDSNKKAKGILNKDYQDRINSVNNDNLELQKVYQKIIDRKKESIKKLREALKKLLDDRNRIRFKYIQLKNSIQEKDSGTQNNPTPNGATSSHMLGSSAPTPTTYLNTSAQQKPRKR